MKLSKAQIAKLTPAERKARDKAIEYKRKYHAKKRLTKKRVVKPLAKVMRHMNEFVDLDRLEVLLRELRDSRAKTASLVKEINDICLRQ